MKIKTYKLSLSRDEEAPELKRLKLEEVNVSVRDVLEHGIHPIGLMGTSSFRDGQAHKKIIRILNEDEFKLKNFVPVGYCQDMRPVSSNWSSDLVRARQPSCRWGSMR